MVYVLKSWAFVIALLSHPLCSMTLREEPDWTFDLDKVVTYNKTPDKLNIDCHVTRIARGVLGLSCTIEVKEDLTDKLRISSVSYFSQKGIHYVKTPYEIPEQNLSQALNIFYKELVMDSLINCTDNALRKEDKFILPIKKSTIHMNNCVFSNANWPRKMASGYYKIILNYTNQAEGYLEVMGNVEPKY